MNRFFNYCATPKIGEKKMTSIFIIIEKENLHKINVKQIEKLFN